MSSSGIPVITPVPYTGAVRNVDLGSHSIAAGLGVISPSVAPSADSTTAFQIRKADNTTSVVNVDTTNGRVGVGTTTPNTVLNVIGKSNTVGAIRVTAQNAIDTPWMEFGVNGLSAPYSTSFGAITNSEGFRFKSIQNVSMIPGASYAFKVLHPNATTTYLTIPANTGYVGIGTTSPNAKLESLATTEQARLSYDSTHYTSFTVGSGGDLTIAPSGGDTNITGNLAVSGAIQPASMADASAPNNSIYYSTTQLALAYKDSSGTVHTLY